MTNSNDIIVIEAEDMTLTGYDEVSGNNASDGGLVKIGGDFGSLTSSFDGDSGLYRLNVWAQDENDGQSTIEIWIGGVHQGTIDLDRDSDGAGGNNSGFSLFTMTDLVMNDGDEIELRAFADGGEFVRIDKVEIQMLSAGDDWEMLLYEDFTDTSENVDSSDFDTSGNEATTNGSTDGELVFNNLDLTGYSDARLTLDTSVISGGFEAWGTEYGDMIKIELVDQDGNVTLLDEFSGVGSEMTGSVTGQVIDADENGGLIYELPSHLTSAIIRISSDISANSEQIAIDNARIVARSGDAQTDSDVGGVAGDRVVLLTEDFGSEWESVVSDNYGGAKGGAKINGKTERSMTFEEVDLSAVMNTTVTFKAFVKQGGFEAWGTNNGDGIWVELIDANGNVVHELDFFSGVGNSLTGSNSGQVINAHKETLSYDIPEGLGAVSLHVRSDISSKGEQVVIDDVEISANEIVPDDTGGDDNNNTGGDGGDGGGDPPPPPPVDEECHIEDGTYALLNHPDGMHNSDRGTTTAVDAYGLVLSNLIGSGVYTFNFEHPDSDMVMIVDGNSITIQGYAIGGEDVGSTIANPELYWIDFTYNNVTDIAGDDDQQVLAQHEGTNSGTVTRVSDGETWDISDKAGSHPNTFQLGDEADDSGHRGHDGVSGWGWFQDDGGNHVGDWLFTVDKTSDNVPVPVPPLPPNEIAIVALDDAYTVLETETSGDVEGNVLDNDVPPTGDSAVVIKLNGDAGAVQNGIALAGSNGGLGILNADGTFDFDANGEFDALNNGESDVTTFTYEIQPGSAPPAGDVITTEGVCVDFSDPNGVQAQVKIVEVNGTLVVTVTVLETANEIGDIRGLFFDIADESLLPGMSVNGSDVTDSQFNANSVSDLGGGANVNGEVLNTMGPFDGGVEIGTQGIGQDDVRSTQFVLSHATEDLTIDLVTAQDFALRLTSVGEEGGNRGDSLKLMGSQSSSEPVPTDIAVITVTVLGESDEVDPGPTPIPDPLELPEALNDAFCVQEDGQVVGNIITGSSNPDGSVTIGQDSDPGGNPLSVISIEGGTVGSPFTVEFDHNGDTYTATVLVEANGDVTITPDANFLALNTGEQANVSLAYTVSTGLTDTHTRVLDFEGLNAGDQASDINSAYPGVTVSASAHGAMVFDSSNPTGGDNDLATDNHGNLLIISEDGDAGDPDDNAGGGTITFDFDSPQTVESILFVDTEEPTPTIQLLDENGQQIGPILNGPVTNDGGIARFTIDVDGVSSMIITLAGSGAVDELVITEEVPEVASAQIDITVKGEDDPDPVDLPPEALNDAFCVIEGGTIGGNIITGDGDTLPGLEADGVDIGVDSDPEGETLSVVELEAGGAGQGGYSVSAGPLQIGSTQTVTVSNGVNTFTGQLTVDANGDLTFVADDFEALNTGEDISFLLNYTVSTGQGGGGGQTQTITFDGFSAGDKAGTINAGIPGVTIDAQQNGSGNPDANHAMIFDSANPTGGDNDLANATQGNILIISEDGDSSDPDDEAHGGTITFTFDDPQRVESLLFLDTEEPTPTIQFLDENGQQIGPILNGPVTTDGGAERMTLGVDGVAQMIVTLAGSGAIDDLEITSMDSDQTASATVEIFVKGEDEAPETATIGDRAWLDANDNQQYDAGEELAGVQVTLLDENGNAVAGQSVTTGADGLYELTGEIGSDYSVRFDASGVQAPGQDLDFLAASGNALASDDDNDADDGDGDLVGETDQFTLTGDTTNVDAGLVDNTPEPATVEGTVWVDANEDGLQGDPDFQQGVTVNLRNADTNMVVGSTTTNASGNYSFTGLAAGNYFVEFANLPANHVFTEKDVNGNSQDAIDSDADTGTGRTDTFALAAGQTVDMDAGIFDNSDPMDATVTGHVWIDANEDGLQGDPDVQEGVTVNLRDAGTDAIVDTTTTNASGDYSFTGLAAGNYYVEVTDLPADHDFTEQDVNGNTQDTLDSDVNVTTGRSDSFALAESGTMDIDAGLIDNSFTDGELTGHVWLDLDLDGIQDGGDEIGLDGVTVSISGVGGFSDTTTTDSDGNYTFSGLSEDDYTITVTQPNGRDFTIKDAGTDDAVDSDVNASGVADAVTVNAGNPTADVDAGVIETGSIGDFLWDDVNGDGIQDVGENGIAGVNIDLLDAGGSVIDSTTTGSDGSYSFDNLGAGDYKVDFSAALGTDQSFSPKGTGTATDSDANTDGVTDLITLSSGQQRDDIDAGVVTEQVQNDKEIDISGEINLPGPGPLGLVFIWDVSGPATVEDGVANVVQMITNSDPNADVNNNQATDSFLEVLYALAEDLQDANLGNQEFTIIPNSRFQPDLTPIVLSADELMAAKALTDSLRGTGDEYDASIAGSIAQIFLDARGENNTDDGGAMFGTDYIQEDDTMNLGEAMSDAAAEMAAIRAAAGGTLASEQVILATSTVGFSTSLDAWNWDQGNPIEDSYLLTETNEDGRGDTDTAEGIATALAPTTDVDILFIESTAFTPFDPDDFDVLNAIDSDGYTNVADHVPYGLDNLWADDLAEGYWEVDDLVVKVDGVQLADVDVTDLVETTTGYALDISKIVPDDGSTDVEVFYSIDTDPTAADSDPSLIAATVTEGPTDTFTFEEDVNI